MTADLTAGTAARRAGAGTPGWAALLAASIGQFLVVLDISVVNVALPHIREGLGLGATGLQWVVNAYSLTFAGFLLLGGRAADLFGRRRVFITGLGLFTLASLAGGFAQDGAMLIGARAFQGLGAAILAPVTLSLVTGTFPEGPARTKAIAMWTAVGTAGGATGGLVGGLLTDYLSWRWVLLINVPVGAAVAAVAARWLRGEGDAAGRRRLDLPGAVLVTAGVGLLTFGIGDTGDHGWRGVVPLAAGLVLLAAFVAVEARTPEPLVQLRLFRLRSVAVGNLATLVGTMAGFALWYFLSLYMQNVLHYSAVRTGLSFLPHTAGIIIGSRLAPPLMARLGARRLAGIGGLMAAAGFAWQSLVLDADGTFPTAILGPGATMALGFGLLMTPLVEASTSGADSSEAGAVAGVVNTSRTIGGAIGLTVLGTAAAHTGPDLVDGYAAAFLVAAAITTAGTAVVPFLPRPPRRAPQSEEAATA
ncbi:EmrB/QacA subfamily drug resistance transporter [Actinomadura coerulea]|uniref:EmrB/QacA subfamily drug resistance transporter n=1 Tax=Actinomadura coerulea TaxID=46159 RepID=A0A7X0KZX7_9ACTN|nr:MFS transporter [Actinomadura coerulea]MBB6396976.1 EmrB/QacA subfamily drug resistance transporter [Actinomadura coerulea]GGP95736.1 MFS transporter [Actinomadura coerulea]